MRRGSRTIGKHQNLNSGKRIWWDQTSPEWIQGVSGTGRAFYNRLVPGGLSKVPGLPDKLAQGVRIADLACGAGVGLERMANNYPGSSLVGVDGDAYSLDVAKERLSNVVSKDRLSLVHSPLEDLNATEEYDLAVNNISSRS